MSKPKEEVITIKAPIRFHYVASSEIKDEKATQLPVSIQCYNTCFKDLVTPDKNEDPIVQDIKRGGYQIIDATQKPAHVLKSANSAVSEEKAKELLNTITGNNAVVKKNLLSCHQQMGAAPSTWLMFHTEPTVSQQQKNMVMTLAKLSDSTYQFSISSDINSFLEKPEQIHDLPIATYESTATIRNADTDTPKVTLESTVDVLSDKVVYRGPFGNVPNSQVKAINSLQILSKNPESINSHQDKEGNTLLHLAIQDHVHPDHIKAIIKQSTEQAQFYSFQIISQRFRTPYNILTAKNKAGKTPLDIAREHAKFYPKKFIQELEKLSGEIVRDYKKIKKPEEKLPAAHKNLPAPPKAEEPPRKPLPPKPDL